jgi:hypothetical protein
MQAALSSSASRKFPAPAQGHAVVQFAKGLTRCDADGFTAFDYALLFFLVHLVSAQFHPWQRRFFSGFVAFAAVAPARLTSLHV